MDWQFRGLKYRLDSIPSDAHSAVKEARRLFLISNIVWLVSLIILILGAMFIPDSHRTWYELMFVVLFAVCIVFNYREVRSTAIADTLLSVERDRLSSLKTNVQVHTNHEKQTPRVGDLD